MPEAPGAEGEKTDKEKPAKSDKNAEEDLSEEDKKLKEELELCVTRLQEPDQKLYAGALECMRKLIRASTTSMTSVPKPLKFMIPHYETMKTVYEKIASSTSPDAVKKECADVLSVLSMTMSENNECLKYKLKGDTSTENMDAWGHEYVRHLAGEIVAEWNDLTTETTEGQDEAMDDLDKKNQLLHLVQQIIPSQMKHHAEAEACDLLMEVERLDYLEQYVDKTAFNRVCLYLTSCVAYVPEPENTNLLKTALKIFRDQKQYPQTMRLALQINDSDVVREIFDECQDQLTQKQLVFMLARQQHFLELDDTEYDEIIEIMSNSHLN